MTETTVYVGKDHLGGYIPGGDSMTWCPELWDYFMYALNVRSVLDVGCGEGHSLKYFRDHGRKVVGVEGLPQPDPDIVTCDFTKLAYLPDRVFDLVWCCEVVEHIEERFMPNYFPSLTAGKFIALTHALPGQEGYHHVNCRDAEYWKGAMASHGRFYDERFTREARRLAPNTHFARTGMIFLDTKRWLR